MSVIITAENNKRINMQTIAIVGLGNIGTKYAMTRHNIGFLSLYAITQILNNPYILHNSLDYQNTKTLLGDLESLVDKKQKGIMQWQNQKSMQSFQAKISLKDFVSPLEYFPFFLTQLKCLNPHKKPLDSLELQKIFREKLGSLSNEYEIVCIAPTTFMNRSGIALQSIEKKCNIAQMIVIYDDLDTRFGNLSFRYKGGSGGHNGLKSIHEYVKRDYLRVKLGIGNNIILHDMLDSLVAHNTRVSIESFRTLFYETYLEKLCMAKIFKTKSLFKVMESKIFMDKNLDSNDFNIRCKQMSSMDSNPCHVECSKTSNKDFEKDISNTTQYNKILESQPFGRVQGVGVQDNENLESTQSTDSINSVTATQNKDSKTSTPNTDLTQKIDSIKQEDYEAIMNLFSSYQKSGDKEVANYVLSPFNTHEKTLLAPLLAYNGLIVMATLFEWAHRNHNTQTSTDSTQTQTFMPLVPFSVLLK